MKDLVLIVLKNVGLLLRYVAWVPLLLFGVVWWYDEWFAAPAILVTALSFYVTGWLLSVLPAPREPRLREGLVIAAVGWLLVPLGSVILFVYAEEWTLVNAYFETMSAWSGTGFTIADVTALSRTTLAWRSLMQWVGGLGVIVLTLAILARPGTGAFQLYVSETREDKLRPSVLSTVRTLWWLYLVLTLASIALLIFTGLSPWLAINHALTGISTAGMSPLPGSVADFPTDAAKWAIILVMIAGATPFVVHYALFRRQFRAPFRDEQVKALILVLVVSAPLLLWALRVTGETSVLNGLFQLVSATTSTGFQTADVGAWPTKVKLGLAGLMVLGGAAGSTAGGIKLVRGALLVKGAMWKLERSGLPPFAVTSFRFGGQNLSRQEANEEFAEAAFIGVLWIGLLFLGMISLVTLLPGVPLENVIFEVASVSGNNGMSVGVISPALSSKVKFIFIGLMWASRLEILPVLLLIRGLLPFVGKR